MPQMNRVRKRSNCFFLRNEHESNFPILKLRSSEAKKYCGHFRISVTHRFYGKSILENSEVLKLPFCYLRGLEFCYFGRFCPSKIAKIHKNFRASKCVKIGILQSPKIEFK